MITSFPRWKFVQKLDSSKDKPSDRTDGILPALKYFQSETELILSCGNPLAEALLDREDTNGLLRLDVYRGLMVAALYLSLKYIPLKSTFWQSIIQGNDPSSCIQKNFNYSCCSESGTIGKIQKRKKTLVWPSS